MATADPDLKVDTKKHLRFWILHTHSLPSPYQSSDSSLLSLHFFIISALDLLGALDSPSPVITPSQKQDWITFIYSHQLPTGGGFRGSPSTALGPHRNLWNRDWDQGSLPNTFLAVLSLIVLGDDLRRLRRREMLRWVGELQMGNGGFGEMLADEGDLGFRGQEGGMRPVGGGDMRSVLCACGLAYLLVGRDQEMPFDEGRVRRYLGQRQAWDGGWGEEVGREGHSGLGYCAVAAMGCMDRLKVERAEEVKGSKTEADVDVERAVDWCIKRMTTWIEEEEEEYDEQEEYTGEVNGKITTTSIANGEQGRDEGDSSPATFITTGFNGRPNKVADTCYAFWNCGALAVLNKEHLVSFQPLRRYLLEKVQHLVGGFGKEPGGKPDLLHSYLGLATLAVHGEKTLKEFDSVLCCSSDVRTKLSVIKSRWKEEDKR